MPRHAFRRAACLTAAGTTLAIAALASPAQAAPYAKLTLQSDAVAVESGSTYRDTYFWGLEREGSGVVENVVFTLDASKVAGLGTLKLDDDGAEACTVAAAVWTCAIGDVRYDDDSTTWAWDPDLTFIPAAGVTGDTTFTMTITGEGAESATVERRLTVADPVSFGINEAPSGDVAVGDRVPLEVTVTNTGDRTIYNPVLSLSFIGMTLEGGHANCGRSNEGSDLTVCRFPVALEPGVTYRLSAPLAYTVNADAFAPGVVDGWVHWTTESTATTTPGTGPELTIVGASPAPAGTPRQMVSDSEGSSWDGYLFKVTGENKANLVAHNSTLPAKTGTTSLTLVMGNAGPASLYDRRSGSSITALWFTLPKGVSLVSLPENCSAFDTESGFTKRGDFVCSIDGPLKVGGKTEVTVQVDVKKVDLAQKGEVKVGYNWYGESQGSRETSTSDNTAAIAFEGAEGGTGGGLADTGVKTGVLAGVGALVVVGGLIALRRFRRRGNPAFYGSVED